MLRRLLAVSILTICASAQDRSNVLIAARQKALDFTASLPNFICSEAIRRLQGPAGSQSLHQTDRLMLHLSYFGGEENHELVSIDNHPPPAQGSAPLSMANSAPCFIRFSIPLLPLSFNGRASKRSETTKPPSIPTK